MEHAENMDVEKKIVGPIPYYYDISIFLSLPSKTSLFNEMAPAKKIYVTNGNTPRNATGRQGTARPAMLKINHEKVALISFKPLVTIHSVYFCIDKCSTWL